MTQNSGSISPEIVKDVARLTTLATPGVLSLVDETRTWGRAQYRGVDVSMDQNAARIDLHVIASTGQNLHHLGLHIQHNVSEAVHEMTGIIVTRVDVTFEDVRNDP